MSNTLKIGDAGRRPSTRRLYHESDLLVWEAYAEKKRIAGQVTLSEDVAGTANVRELSPAYMRRDFDGVGVSIVPQPGAVDMQLQFVRRARGSRLRESCQLRWYPSHRSRSASLENSNVVSRLRSMLLAGWWRTAS